LERFDVQPGFFMTVSYLEAQMAVAASLSALMAGARAQRTGNSGWIDTIRDLSHGLVGAGDALWPAGGGPPAARQWCYRDCRLRVRPFFPRPPPA
jgi:hypothetical protein